MKIRKNINLIPNEESTFNASFDTKKALFFDECVVYQYDFGQSAKSATRITRMFCYVLNPQTVKHECYTNCEFSITCNTNVTPVYGFRNTQNTNFMLSSDFATHVTRIIHLSMDFATRKTRILCNLQNMEL